MKKALLIVVLFLITLSCNMSDYSEELSGDYTFIHEGQDYNFIIGRNEIYANVVDYKFDDNYIVVCQVPNRSMYLSNFASTLSGKYSTYYSYLKDSTTEKYYRSRNEILRDTVIPRIFKNRKISFQNTSEDIQKQEEIADSIIQNDSFHVKVFSLKKVYWIIKVKSNNLIGPLSYAEYKQKKQEFNLSNDLLIQE